MILAEPVSQPSRVRHSDRRAGPAAQWIACELRVSMTSLALEEGHGVGHTPSTPPPPRRDSFAALTMESSCSFVMSFLSIAIFVLCDAFAGCAGEGCGERRWSL